jgi:flavin-dependent dehydrogenase
VIAAAGLAARFAGRELGGERVSSGSRIGGSAVLEAGAATPWTDHAINIAIGAEGYVGAVRLEDGRWNLAAAVDIAASRRRRGIGPVVAAILESAGWSVPETAGDLCWQGTPQLSRRPRRVAVERLFAVGDAAGYVEPFTGEGMACALEGGRAVVPLALQAIERWEPRLEEAWARLLTDRVQRKMMLSTMVAWSVRQPRFAAAIVRLLALWPAIAAPAVAHAAAPAPGDRGGRL